MNRTIAMLSAACWLAACSSTGIVPADKGTYLIAKKSAQVGFGPPVGIKGEAYSEANEFCSKQGKAVETVDYKETNAGFAQSAAVSLTFRCVEK